MLKARLSLRFDKHVVVSTHFVGHTSSLRAALWILSGYLAGFYEYARGAGYTNLEPRFLPSSIMPIILRPFLSSLSLAVLALKLRQPVPARCRGPATPAALQALAEVRTEYGAGHYGEVIRRVARSDELAAAPRSSAYRSVQTAGIQLLREQLHPAVRRRIRAHTAPGLQFHAGAQRSRTSAWGPVFRAAQSKNRHLTAIAAASSKRPLICISGLLAVGPRPRGAPPSSQYGITRPESSDGVSAAGASGSPPTVTGASSNGLASCRAASRSAASNASLSLRAM